MLAQFDHLSETYFNGFEQDLGERELGYALSFDHDLDVFAASIGLTKTSVAAILDDEGALHYQPICHGFGHAVLFIDVVLRMDGYDPEEDLIEPLQKLLEQCKSAKVLSKLIHQIFWRTFAELSTGNSQSASRTSFRSHRRSNRISSYSSRLLAMRFLSSSTLVSLLVSLHYSEDGC